MEEISVEKLKETTDINSIKVVYFYTTMCGTCQLAKRMLDIVEKTIDDLSIYSTNVNYLGEKQAKAWEVESVPCLIVFENGKILEKVYAFQSVDYLFRLLKRYS